MSTLSDVQALYDSVRDKWANSQAHIVAHVVLVGIVFWICGDTILQFSIVLIDPKLISTNEWFQLAKDTGTLYVSFLIPILMLAIYVVLLRTGGQLLVVILMLILPPSPRTNRYRLLTPWVLEPLAIILEKSDFVLNDLENKSSDLALKYQSRKNEQWETYQKSINKLTKNAQIYLGDFLIFLLSWIAIFIFLPQISWVQINDSKYWEILLFLLALAWFAWYRVSRAITVIPSMLMIYVSTMIRTDSDMKDLLEVTEERREEVRERLLELLRKEQERTESGPSLLGFIKYKAGFQGGTQEEEKVRQKRGWPFPSLYQNGVSFSFYKHRYTQYDKQWLAGYFAYLYYRFHKRLSVLVKSLWQLARYIVTGAP